MKKFTSLLIGVSLALAGAAFAQQPEESPAKGKKQGTEKTEQAEPKAAKTRGEHAAKPEATAKQTGAMKEQGATGAEQGTGKGHKGKAANAAETGVSGQTGGTTPTEQGAGKGRKAGGKSETATGTETNVRSEEHTSELQSHSDLVCRLL